MVRRCDFNQTESTHSNLCITREITFCSRTDINKDVSVKYILDITRILVNGIRCRAKNLL